MLFEWPNYGDSVLNPQLAAAPNSRKAGDTEYDVPFLLTSAHLRISAASAWGRRRPKDNPKKLPYPPSIRQNGPQTLKKPQANMASTRSKTEKPVPTLEEFGANVLRRREAYKAKYGREPDLPRNSGENRTESKKALLKAIKDIGGKW
jgi:hypothetical protein